MRLRTASCSKMSEDGLKVAPLAGRRIHGAPWSRAYSREVWRDLEFPEGFWFEDTVQRYCIDTRFRGRYVNRCLYRYRGNGDGISARCSKFKKGLDTFWVVEEMVRWCRELEVEFDRGLFDRALHQLGPLIRDRTAALDGREKEALFVASCELLDSIPEFAGMHASKGGRWDDLLLSLRSMN